MNRKNFNGHMEQTTKTQLDQTSCFLTHNREPAPRMGRVQRCNLRQEQTKHHRTYCQQMAKIVEFDTTRTDPWELRNTSLALFLLLVQNKMTTRVQHMPIHTHFPNRNRHPAPFLRCRGLVVVF